MVEVVHVTATRLVCRRREHIWVGYEHGVHSQETGGSGGGGGGNFSPQERHSTFERLPSISDGRDTTTRSLRRERVGWTAGMTCLVTGVSRVRVVSFHRRCQDGSQPAAAV